MTTSTDTRTVPTPLPVPGEKLKDLMARVKKIFPKFVPGKQVEVDSHLVEVRDYANYAIAYWETQRDTANLLIQQQMGDAEIAAVGGIPVMKRYQGEVKAYFVDTGWNDYLKGVKH